MKCAVSAFVSRVKTIAARPIKYRTGGVGKDGTCDCIGLIMGAMYELGRKKYDLHSTNYFARYQVEELKPAKEKELFVGQLLFRSRTSTDKLNERYKRGGSHYTGDLLDYYHVAVVTRTKPLEIIECTEYGNVTGIVVNKVFKNWQHGAKLKEVLYDGYDEEDDPVLEALIPRNALYEAVVITQKDPLTIREWPESGPRVGKAPKGATVEVLSEAGDGWPMVRYNGVTGYALETYIKRIDGDGSDDETELDVIIADVVDDDAKERITIIDAEGNVFRPVGDFKVLFGAVD